MIIQYKCSYCGDLFYHENKCKKHELEECSQNPSVKSCVTCKYEISYWGESKKIYFGCKKDIIETSPMAYKKNCEFWECDEGYHHRNI